MSDVGDLGKRTCPLCVETIYLGDLVDKSPDPERKGLSHQRCADKWREEHG